MKKAITALLSGMIFFTVANAQSDFTYTVRSGDTLSTIAQRFGLTAKSLAEYNGIKIDDPLHVGKTLKLYSPSEKSVKYVVKSGDTLSAIAQRFGMKTDMLAKRNGLDQSETIRSGQVLYIVRTPKKSRIALETKSEKKKRHSAVKRIIQKKSKAKKRFASSANRIKRKRKEVYYTIIKKKPFGFRNFNMRLADKVTKLAKQKLGRRYVWGATGSNAFDCSGLTTYVYKKVGVNLPRTSRNQARFGKYVPKHKLRKGDLVFFDTDLRRRGIDHVGIYLGNGKFIHASSAKKKVIITSLNKPFYAKRFRGGRRVLKSSI